MGIPQTTYHLCPEYISQRSCQTLACLLLGKNENTLRRLIGRSLRLKVSCDLNERNPLNESTTEGPCADVRLGVRAASRGQQRLGTGLARAVTVVNALVHFHSSSRVRFRLSAFCRTDPEIASFNP